MRRPSLRSGSPALLATRSRRKTRCIRCAHCAHTSCANPVLEAREYARGCEPLRCSAPQKGHRNHPPCALLQPLLAHHDIKAVHCPSSAGRQVRGPICGAEHRSRPELARRSKRCVERPLSEHRRQSTAAAAAGDGPAGGRRASWARGSGWREAQGRLSALREGRRIGGRVPAGLGCGATTLVQRGRLDISRSVNPTYGVGA